MPISVSDFQTIFIQPITKFDFVRFVFVVISGAFYAISYEGALKGLKNFNPLNDIIDSFAWAERVKCYLPAVVERLF